MNNKIHHLQVWLLALLIVLMALPAVALSAQTQIVDIDSRVNDVQHAVEVVLDAGTYSVTPIGTNEGGAFNSWNAWSFTNCTDVNGCPQTVPTTFEGWLNRYWVSSPNLTKVSINGTALTPVSVKPVPLSSGNIFVTNASETFYQADDSKVYPADIVALAKSQSSTFTLSESGQVRFAINDPALFDNVGGISLRVTQESTTPIAIDPTSVPKAIKIGEFFSKQLQVLSGVGPFSWSVIDGQLPSGMILDADGVLSGTPTALGTSSFTIQVSNAEDIAEKTFAVDIVLELPPMDIRLEKGGTRAVPGRTYDQFIVVENKGNAIASDVQIVDILHSSFDLLSMSPSALTESSPFGNVSVLWDLGDLNPGGTAILHEQLNIKPSTGLAVDVGTPVCTSAEIVGISQCIQDQPWWLFPGSCASASAACAAVPPSCAGPPWLFCPATIWGCYEAIKPCLKEQASMGGCFKQFNCDLPNKLTSGPVDPNEKLVVAKKFIQGDQTLVYPVHFENIGNIEARDVFVTDILDANLDLSALKLLTPTGGSIDIPTRTINWSLLNKNLEPGKTDNVLLSVKPKPGLPSGTEIKNKATIQFEIFEPLTTNEVVNVIDSTPPVCSMAALPAQTAKLDIPIAWSGSDAIGEIDTYSILVAENGGDFQPFPEKTKSTSTTFNGTANNSYEFICLATDTAGNTENQELLAEATIKIEVIPNQPPLVSAGPDMQGVVGQPVTLQGSASDPDSGPKPLTYSWTQTSGPTVTLSGANTLTPNFTPMTPGIYMFALQVSDGKDFAAASVTVTAVADIPIRVVQPNGGETWKVGLAQTIKWSTSPNRVNPKAPAIILLSKDGGSRWFPIGIDLRSKGSYTWKPWALFTTQRALIQVCTLSKQKIPKPVCDVSDATFTITK